MSYVSTDGVTWHRSPAGQADLLNMGLSDVASVGDRLIGLGWYDAIAPTITPGPYVMSSSDGPSVDAWRSAELDTRAVPSALAVVDGTIVVMLNEPSGVFVLTSQTARHGIRRRQRLPTGLTRKESLRGHSTPSGASWR